MRPAGCRLGPCPAPTPGNLPRRESRDPGSIGSFMAPHYPARGGDKRRTAEIFRAFRCNATRPGRRVSVLRARSQVCERLGQEPRDVHLADPELARDLALRLLLEEPEVEDRALALGELLDQGCDRLPAVEP